MKLLQSCREWHLADDGACGAVVSVLSQLACSIQCAALKGVVIFSVLIVKEREKALDGCR